jgi:hypothetical protein
LREKRYSTIEPLEYKFDDVNLVEFVTTVYRWVTAALVVDSTHACSELFRKHAL